MLLNQGIIERAQTTGFLAALAAVLGYDSVAVMKAGPRPWLVALQSAQDNVAGNERQTFLSFLLSIAIRRPLAGTELIFERAFESVHNDIGCSRLSSEGMAILSRLLPNIGWFEKWDTCKRLRVAVVSAYIDGGLNPLSFYRLAHDQHLWSYLHDQADHSKKGRQFLKMISA